MSYFRNYNKILPILSSKHSSITSLISAYTKGTLQNLQARVTPTEGGLKMYPTRITALHLRYSICHVQLPKSLALRSSIRANCNVGIAIWKQEGKKYNGVESPSNEMITSLVYE